MAALRWMYDDDGNVSLQFYTEENGWEDVPLVDQDGNVIEIQQDGDGEMGRFWGLN